MSPIRLTERVEALDVLRGAALFGILAANMRAFNSPMPAYIDHFLMWTGGPDRIAQGAIDLLISGKFITLFSFLFGIGFAVQMERADARGIPARSFYLRRLTVLLAMGIAHMLLLWWGDILAPYALMGFLLFLFRKRTQRTILLWAGGLYCWPLILAAAALAVTSAGVALPMPRRATPAELQRIIAVYASGSYLQILREHLKEAMFSVAGLIFFYPRVLGIFLLGLWTWRTGVIQSLGEHAALLRRCRRWGLAVGLGGNALMLALVEILRPDYRTPSLRGYGLMLIGSVAVPALSLFYAASLALLLRDGAWRARLHPFAAVGRNALSNYLLETVVCTTLYNSWGLGLFGRVGPLVGLAPTVILYAAQLAASQWWVNRFAFGPVEWLWRALTYGQAPRMARAGAA